MNHMSYDINLHSHSLLSDGVLLPSEVAMRYAAKGYKAIAITDHTDYSNIDTTIKSIRDFCRHWPKKSSLRVLPGVELTHLPLEQFGPLTRYARKNGIKVIIAHGETVVEPVLKGTNRAALEADIDILAHPGLITEAELKIARQKGVFLEITSRKGHNKTNAYVVNQALAAGVKLVLNNDSHSPEDIISPVQLFKVGLRAGLTRQHIGKMYQNVLKFLKDT